MPVQYLKTRFHIDKKSTSSGNEQISSNTHNVSQHIDIINSEDEHKPSESEISSMTSLHKIGTLIFSSFKTIFIVIVISPIDDIVKEISTIEQLIKKNTADAGRSIK